MRKRHDLYDDFEAPIKPHRKSRYVAPALSYSERKKLGQMYSKWAAKNNVADKPESLIGYLQMIGAIDEEAARNAMKYEEGEV